MNDIEPTIFAFDPAAARGFEALVDYFERLDDVGAYRSRRTPAHLMARSREFTAVSADKAWSFGAAVLARAFGDELAPDEDAMTQDGRALVEALNREIEPFLDALEEAALLYAEVPSPRLGRRPREQHVASAASLLRDIALENRGVDVTVSSGPDGQPVILAMSIDEPLTFIRCYASLMDIIEMRVRTCGIAGPSMDVFARYERQASAWWFDRLTAPAISERDEIGKALREQEFSLFDRKAVCLGDTLASAVARRLPRNALTPHQRVLLEGIGRGVCGLFIVRQQQGPIAVLEDVDTGTSYEVRRYDREFELEEGSVMTGRLVPIPGLGWLPSPGAIWWGKQWEARLIATGKRLRRALGETHRSTFVEIVMSYDSEESLPRPVPPVSSQKDAEELVKDLKEILADIDLPETSLDLVLEHWLFAITELAGLTARGLGADREIARSHKKKGKRSRRRRR